MALYKVTSGSWGSALNSAAATISVNTAYTLKVARKQSQVQVALVGQSSLSYDSTTDLDTGKSGLYASHSDIKFDNFKAYRGVARDAKTPDQTSKSRKVQTRGTALRLSVPSSLRRFPLVHPSAFIPHPSCGASSLRRCPSPCGWPSATTRARTP